MKDNKQARIDRSNRLTDMRNLQRELLVAPSLLKELFPKEFAQGMSELEEKIKRTSGKEKGGLSLQSEGVE